MWKDRMTKMTTDELTTDKITTRNSEPEVMEQKRRLVVSESSSRRLG